MFPLKALVKKRAKAFILYSIENAKETKSETYP